jgi:hypothetical protein
VTLQNSEFVPGWDVARDRDGQPITITEEQMHAIWRAVRVVEDVRRAEGYPSLWKNPQPDLYKSRLLGRMLLDGKPPTKTKPPMEMGGPCWACLPGGDPFGEAGA